MSVELTCADNLYDPGMLISMSKELNDPEFIIEIEGKAFTRLKLETYLKIAVVTAGRNFPKYMLMGF